jgi:hypothetical protein
MKTWMPWVVCLALGAGCVEQPTQPNRGGASQQELERIRRQVVSRTAPTPQHALSFNWDNKVELLGYDINVQNNTLRPGQSVTVTWYWKCRAPTGDGWRLFTHLDDANGPRTNQDNVGDTRRAYQPERWRAGEFIRDTQSFELPADWDSPTVRVHLGVWKDGQPRMAVTPADRTDGDRRARVLELNTGVQVQLTETVVPRATGAITADGRLDEAAWANAARTGPLVNPGNGNPASATEAHATAMMLWDDANLYVGFRVTDDNLVDPSSARDDHLWEHDAVEVMIDPDGDGANYYEFQVSPKNQRFDTRYDRPRQPQPFGHLDFNPETRSGVAATGTIGNADDNDTGYDVELVIPWASINNGLAHTPPQPGDQVRVNLFVMDEPKTGGQRSAAWSAPRGGDFHALARFGRITLAVDAPGAPAAPAAAALPAVPSAAAVPNIPGLVQPLPAALNNGAVPLRRPAPAAH